MLNPECLLFISERTMRQCCATWRNGREIQWAFSWPVMLLAKARRWPKMRRKRSGKCWIDCERKPRANLP